MKKFDFIIFKLSFGTFYDKFVLDIFCLDMIKFYGSLFYINISKEGFDMDILYIVGIFRYIKNNIKDKWINSDK